MAGSSKLTRWIPARLTQTPSGNENATDNERSESVQEHQDGATTPEDGNAIEQEHQFHDVEDAEIGLADAAASSPPPLAAAAAAAAAHSPSTVEASRADLTTPPPPDVSTTPVRSAGTSLASHPVTPQRQPPSNRRTSSLPTAMPSRPPNSQVNAGNGNDLQTHLRKVTANLVDILDSMSTSNSANTTPAGSSKDGIQPRRHTMASRGDSVATMMDLEAAPSVPGTEEAVPAHHVRRLTTTIVDMLRSMSTNPTSAVAPTADAVRLPREVEAHAEGVGLLADCGSELSLDAVSDKLSLTSAGGTSARDSEISATTALLKAQYLPHPEYRGDEVRPFFMDRPGVISGRGGGASSASPSSNVFDEDVGDDGTVAEDPAEIEDDKKGDVDVGCPLPKHMKKKTRVNWIGLAIFVFFCAALITYVGIRSSKTLGLGASLWYGVIVLLVEILGGLAMLPYGLCLTMYVDDEVPEAITAASKGQTATTTMGYHVRVIIPCYKEPLDVISKTFMAAMYAALPANCRRTVYLCDDGRDDAKRRFVRSLGMANAVYVSGRKRSKGEMNGKSANINNAMRQIYPPGVPIPLDEVICVFDADQVPNADFFSKTVPLMDGGQDVAMVLSPQTFYNLNPDGDIFNHANVHFWDYTQPGYDALGLISCTGTNFLLRARAFAEAEWFPEWTLTEDFALGIELKRRGWQCRYVDEYLAVGEAPDEVRNCFQQRSRWAKGHFQVFFGRGRNPILGRGARGLSPLMRWMYGSVVLSYFSAFLATPLLMLVPIITVWFGAFPIVINFWAALSITLYYGSTLALMYYTHSLGHLKSMWFASVSNSVLWFAYLKAMYRATIGRWLSGTIVFKVTAKGLQKLNNLPLRDVWMATVWFVFSLITLIFGLVHFFTGKNWDTPLAISIIFMVYNLVPQYLLLQYAVFRPRMFFNAVCRLCMLLSTAMAIMGVVLIWILYPKSYDMSSALGSSLYFMDTQRVGQLPDDFRVSWRKSSFLAESAVPVYLAANPNDTLLAGLGGLGGGSGDFAFSGFSADPFGGSFGGDAGFGGDPFGRRLLQEEDPFAAAFEAGGDSPEGAAWDPFAVPDDSASGASDGASPFAAAADSADAVGGGAADPFAAPDTTAGGSAVGSDPFAVPADPTATTAGAADPFAAPDAASATSADPFAASAAPAATTTTESAAAADPFAVTPSPTSADAAASSDPFAAPSSAGGAAPPDPFAAPVQGAAGGGGDLFATDAVATAADPFAASDPFAADPATGGADPFDPFATNVGGFSEFEEVELATPEPWDLTGGWLSGMEAGNMKATAPLAFTTTLLAWGYMAFQEGYQQANQVEALKESVRWGADYLSKVHRYNPQANTSLIVSRVGDVDTELLLWYRPEDHVGPRDAYVVDLNAEAGGYGADLGGSVAASLASAASLFGSSEDEEEKQYGATLLSRAKEIYAAARSAKLPYTGADFNMSLVYNSTTVYDDLAWGAGWLYKATRDEAYLGDVYDFYVKHLQAEGEIADWKYAFDWDNVFWPLNVLLAQETGKGTFKKQSEQFLRSWMCADNAAIYTRRGRAFNPATASLGATTNAAMLALMYADVAQAESQAAAQTYRCWGLSQLRYVLGDAGRSLVAGLGSNPPQRTQDRAAACPPPPAVCNRVTGLLSPDPDSFTPTGALMYGPGNSDNFLDVRSNDAARVGVENNAGFTGALAGAVLLPDGMWEVCLQEFGIYRSNPVCGSFVTL